MATKRTSVIGSVNPKKRARMALAIPNRTRKAIVPRAVMIRPVIFWVGLTFAPRLLINRPDEG